MTASSQRLTVGIIGAGDIVTTIHLPVLLAMEEISVAWVADVNSGRAKSAARAYGVNHANLPKRLTDLPYTDIVLLAVPYGVREPYYCALRERPSALYVEKPFSRTIEEHRRICSWFPDYRLALGLQKRSWGPVLLVQQFIREELFGPLRLARCGLGGRGVVLGGKYHSDVRLAGGGILFEMGVHGIDTLLFCTNATAAQINSVAMVLDSEFDVHTNADLLLTTERDERIGCQVTFSFLQDTINGWEFVFDHAVLSLLFSGESVDVKATNDSGTWALLPAQGRLYPLTAYETFYEHWSRFLIGIHARQANWTSASRSILTTEVIERFYDAGLKSDGTEGR